MNKRMMLKAEAKPSLSGKRSSTIRVMQGVSSDHPKAIRQTGPIALTGVAGKNRRHVKNDVKVVIACVDRNVTFEKVKIASRLIRNRARFIATNIDPNIPRRTASCPEAVQWWQCSRPRPPARTLSSTTSGASSMPGALRYRTAAPREVYAVIVAKCHRFFYEC
jgi:hypothetical protein